MTSLPADLHIILNDICCGAGLSLYGVTVTWLKLFVQWPLYLEIFFCIIFFRSYRWHLSILHASRQAHLSHVGLYGWPEKDLRPQGPGQLVCILNPTKRHTRRIKRSFLASATKPYLCYVLARYPEARAIQRKVIFHAGPTNSGKTYHAIQRYLAAKSGVYCGPLKLLAHEIFEKSNDAVRNCAPV